MATKTHCHWQIAKTAKEFAGVFYEENARDDIFYRAHPNQKAFIDAYWGKFTETARKILAQMLAMNYPDEMKEQIAEALTLDASYSRGRRSIMLPNVISPEQAESLIH